MQKVQEWERECKGKWKYIILIANVNSSSHAIIISIQLRDPTPMIAKSVPSPLFVPHPHGIFSSKRNITWTVYMIDGRKLLCHTQLFPSKHRWYCWCSNQMLIKPLWPTSKCFCFCRLRDRRDPDSRTESFYQSWSSFNPGKDFLHDSFICQCYL